MFKGGNLEYSTVKNDTPRRIVLLHCTFYNGNIFTGTANDRDPA